MDMCLSINRNVEVLYWCDKLRTPKGHRLSNVNCCLINWITVLLIGHLLFIEILIPEIRVTHDSYVVVQMLFIVTQHETEVGEIPCHS